MNAKIRKIVGLVDRIDYDTNREEAIELVMERLGAKGRNMILKSFSSKYKGMEKDELVEVVAVRLMNHAKNVGLFLRANLDHSKLMTHMIQYFNQDGAEKLLVFEIDNDGLLCESKVDLAIDYEIVVLGKEEEEETEDVKEDKESETIEFTEKDLPTLEADVEDVEIPQDQIPMANSQTIPVGVVSAKQEVVKEETLEDSGVTVVTNEDLVDIGLSGERPVVEEVVAEVDVGDEEELSGEEFTLECDIPTEVFDVVDADKVLEIDTFHLTLSLTGLFKPNIGGEERMAFLEVMEPQLTILADAIHTLAVHGPSAFEDKETDEEVKPDYKESVEPHIKFESIDDLLDNAENCHTSVPVPEDSEDIFESMIEAAEKETVGGIAQETTEEVSDTADEEMPSCSLFDDFDETAIDVSSGYDVVITDMPDEVTPSYSLFDDFDETAIDVSSGYDMGVTETNIGGIFEPVNVVGAMDQINTIFEEDSLTSLFDDELIMNSNEFEEEYESQSYNYTTSLFDDDPIIFNEPQVETIDERYYKMIAASIKDRLDKSFSQEDVAKLLDYKGSEFIEMVKENRVHENVGKLITIVNGLREELEDSRFPWIGVYEYLGQK